jgi:hypothetical protein
MATEAPNSFRDPYYTQLASNTESKLGLPDGLLSSIVTKGERSNADQVSEAGARSVFQIIPATRKAAIAKFGIDPYLSPENAAEVAGLLLKDSLDRNKGDVAAAVSEYHGGTDRANWGPRTRSYVQRVLGELPSQQPSDPAADQPAEPSTFKRALAAQQATDQHASAIANVFDAYKAGRMTPDESKQFEADVKSGLVMLPKGSALIGAPQPTVGTSKPEPLMLPQGVTDAYVGGRMTQQERAQLESDINAGLVKLPPSAQQKIPTGPNWAQPTEQGVIPQAVQPTIGQRAVGALEAGANAVTGFTGGNVGMVVGAAKGIAQSIIDGTYGQADAARAVEQAAASGASALTYQPRTETGQDYATAVGEGMQNLMAVAPMMHTLPPAFGGVRPAAPASVLARAGAEGTARDVVNAVARPAEMAGVVSPGAVGDVAAGAVGATIDAGRTAATNAADGVVRAGNAAADGSRRVVNVVANAPTKAAEMMGWREPAADVAPAPAASGRASGGAAAVPQDMVRAQKSQNLPVPIDLTLGAESRDAAQLAFEKEQMKGPLGQPLRDRTETNNLQAMQNFEKLIDSTDAQAPDIAAAGNKVVNTLSSGLKAAKNQTNIAYAKARNSPEALLSVDPAQEVTIRHAGADTNTSLIGYLNSVPDGLKTTGLTDHAKQYAVRLGVATKGADGQLVPRVTDVKTMEALRTEISQATGYEPIEIRHATILKKLIDAATEPLAGPLYKQARILRESQARKYENRAVVARLITDRKGMDDPKVAVDQVFNKSVLNGSPEEITFLKRVLQTNGKNGAQAWKELQAATLKHIQEEATKSMGMDSNDRPIISPAKLHNVVSMLDKNGRLDIVLGKKQAEIVRDLNDVVRYVNTVPPGTLINNSGTAGTILAAMGEAGAMATLTGVPLPVRAGLKALGQHVKDNKIKLKINRALNVKPAAAAAHP